MRRSFASCAAALLCILVSGLVTSAGAAPPTGTVSCTGVQGILSFSRGLAIADDPSSNRWTEIALDKAGATTGCDGSGVTGARLPITGALVSLKGRTIEGETCADFLGTLILKNAKLRVTWRGVTATGRERTVASSRATIASAVYDGDAQVLVFVTQLITSGAFRGSPLTFHMSLPSSFASNCGAPPSGFDYLTLPVGFDGRSTVDVP